jgi:hypothetical protein
MKTGVYKISNLQAGSFGFGEHNLGLVFFPDTHPKNNHGLTEFDNGYYVKKSDGEIWKLNGRFKEANSIDILRFYFRLCFRTNTYKN